MARSLGSPAHPPKTGLPSGELVETTAANGGGGPRRRHRVSRRSQSDLLNRRWPKGRPRAWPLVEEARQRRLETQAPPVELVETTAANGGGAAGVVTGFRDG